MHVIRRLVPAVILGLNGVAGYAADADGHYYLGGRVSLDEVADLTVDAGPILGDLEVARGWGLGAVLGRHLGDPWRVELEWMLHSGQADELPALGLEQLSGSVDVNTLTVNLIVDLPFDGSSLAPYVGVGAGWASVELDGVGGEFLRISGKDNSTYALQGFAGVAIALSDSLTLDLDARYTWVNADNLVYAIEPGASFDGGAADVETIGLTAGLRFDL